MSAVRAVVLPASDTAVLGAPTPKPTSLTGQLESSLTVWETAGAEAGVWEAEPGTFTATRDGYDEVCVVLAGRARIYEPDGTSFEIALGDILITPAGWTGTWEVTETLRKAYVIREL